MIHLVHGEGKRWLSGHIRSYWGMNGRGRGWFGLRKLLLLLLASVEESLLLQVLEICFFDREE